MKQKEQSSLPELDNNILQDIQGGSNQNQGTNIGLGVAGVVGAGATLAGGVAIGKRINTKEISGLKNQIGQLQCQNEVLYNQVRNLGR